MLYSEYFCKFSTRRIMSWLLLTLLARLVRGRRMLLRKPLYLMLIVLIAGFILVIFLCWSFSFRSNQFIFNPSISFSRILLFFLPDPSISFSRILPFLPGPSFSRSLLFILPDPSIHSPGYFYFMYLYFTLFFSTYFLFYSFIFYPCLPSRSFCLFFFIT